MSESDSTSETQTCCKCGVEYPLTARYFSRRSIARRGFAHKCKGCTSRNPKQDLMRRKMLCAEGNKVCGHCLEELPATADHFTKHVRSKDGLYSICKTCSTRANLNRYYANREEISEQRRVGYAIWYAARTPEELAKRREARAEYQKQYYKNNRERQRIHRLNYIARKNGAGGSHTFNEIQAMYDDQQGLCAYCETPLFGTYHVDHMVPLSRGGRNDWTNLAVTCPLCNDRKAAKTTVEFMEMLRLVEKAA